MKIIALATALISFSALSIAGPFGLEMGSSLTDLKKQIPLKPENTGLYTTQSVPTPHPDFQSYNLIISPNHGLCKIIALSKNISTSIYGSELINKFSNIESALTNKYGTPQKFDHLRHGSLWKEPRDWMMGLLKRERTLSSFWSNDKQTLPDHLQAISIEARAASTELAGLILTYEFTNTDQCLDWIKSQKNSGL